MNKQNKTNNMATTLEISKSLLSPPGDTIQEHIDFIGMSQAELAEGMGIPKEKIDDIIKGREPITTATAFQLEKVLGIPESFWLNREKAYRKELYELQWRNDNRMGLRIVILAYLFFLIVISIWAIWYSIFIE